MVGNFVDGLGRHVRARNALRSSGEAFPARRLKKSAAVSTAPISCAIAAVIHWFSHASYSQPARAGAALIEAGSFRGTDELVLEAAVNGRADALVTCNLGHFAQGAARFRQRLARPGA